MRILILSSYPERLADCIELAGDSMLWTSDPIDASFLHNENIDFIVSYGYRHIISKAVLEKLPGKIINLHISYLPWNKGADPNFWSFFDDTPKGVSIHLIDEGLDTGDILCQRLVDFSEFDTLASSHSKLQSEIEELFKENWSKLRLSQLAPAAQQGKGSSHLAKHKLQFMEKMPLGWLTLVTEVADAGRRYRGASELPKLKALIVCTDP